MSTLFLWPSSQTYPLFLLFWVSSVSAYSRRTRARIQVPEQLVSLAGLTLMSSPISTLWSSLPVGGSLQKREMRHQQLYNRQIVKALEDTKRTMGKEISELRSEVRSLKSKLADDESSIPARIKQAERAAVPWDRYTGSRAPSPTRRIGGMLGR
jgi:hypothetical protein